MLTVVTRRTTAPPASVFAILADGWRYADWVVGAKAIRHVDEEWPAPGARFHHRVGVGPVEVRDSSVCEAVDPPHALSLRVRAFPAGAARVRIVLRPAGDGTEILLEEHPIEGLARRFDNPLLRLALRVRNAWSLRRLSKLAETGVPQRA